MNSAIKNKLKWLILPAQSGKTRKVEDKITLQKVYTDAHKNTSDLNIWISANNKLLVQQTTSRIKKDLGTVTYTSDEEKETCDAVIEGNIFSWMSGSKNTNVSIGELARAVTRKTSAKRVDMIVLCAHPSRLKYLNALLEDIIEDIERRISIWVDEADRTVNLWIKYLDNLKYPAIRQMTLVSATFDGVRESLGDIEVIPYVDTVPACYRGLTNCEICIEEISVANPVDYVKAVIEKHKTKLVVPGICAFIPGDNSQKSHEDISTMLIETYGFAVLILNGKSKEIRLPLGDIIDLKPFLTVKKDKTPEEFNKILACIYSDHKLERFPLAVTGFICVERGVTFQLVPINGLHDGFLFDYAIINKIINPSEAYQTMARVFGNIGDSPYYKPVIIYTDEGTFNRVARQEKIAMNIAKIVERYNVRGVGDLEIELACGEPHKSIIHADDFKMEWKEYTIEEAKKNPDLSRYLEELTNEDGYYWSNIGQKASKLSYTDLLKVKNGSKTAQLRVKAEDMQIGEDNGQHRRYVGYKDINNPSSAVVVDRYVWRINAPKTIVDRVKERSVVMKTGNPFC